MTVLIVDDEQAVRGAIRMLADWPGLGVDEILEAETVEQAMTCLRRDAPQLVLTDIRMPQHDGFELMLWIHQNKPQTKVIVISAYNEFEYAIRAMRLGALDYLLKPIQPMQLDAVLQKAIAFLNTGSPKSDDSFSPDADARIWLALCAEGEVEFVESTPAAAYLFAPAGMMVLSIFCIARTSTIITVTKKQISAVLRELVEKDGSGLVLHGVKQQNLFYFLLKGTAEKQAQTAARILAFLRETLGFSPVYALRYNAIWSDYEYPTAIAELISAVQNASLMADPSEGSASQLTPDMKLDLPAEMEQLLRACISACPMPVSVTLDSLQAWWESICGRFIKGLQAYPQLERTRPIFLPGQALLPFLNDKLHMDMALLLSYLHAEVQSLSNQNDFLARQDADVCAQIRKEIQTHYAEPHSLASLAAKYYRNPSYLSRAFKERYHVSIMSFLAETRVEQAKILLKTTDYRISEISHIIGYTDEKYFCRVFKRTSGLSPVEYRNL